MKKINAIRDYGFNEDLIQLDEKDYILGVNSELPNIIYRQDFQWPTVVYEPQAEKYETSGCTVWGGENQIEIFEKEVFGAEPNYDERFSYLNAKVTLDGANPQNFYQSVRKEGLIANEPLPETYEEFSDRSYLTDARNKRGKKWTEVEYELLHDYLPDTYKGTIKANLMFSPVALSVTAWATDENGFYIDNNQRNTHWCTCYGYVSKEEVNTPEKAQAIADEFNVERETLVRLVTEGKIILKILDSYDHSKKLLHPDHKVAIAKRIHVRKRELNEDTFTEANWLEKIWEAIKKILGIFESRSTTQTPVLSNREKLYETAKSLLSKEVSPNDVAPDELACVESLNEVYKKAFGTIIWTGTAYTSTSALFNLISTDSRFDRITAPLFGDIILTPTGTGNGTRRGHCGVVGKQWIMSNDSRTGTWEANYTIESWLKFFAVGGGMPVYYFRVK